MEDVQASLTGVIVIPPFYQTQVAFGNTLIKCKNCKLLFSTNGEGAAHEGLCYIHAIPGLLAGLPSMNTINCIS